MIEESRSLNPSQYSKFKPQNITVQDLAELLPFVVSEWNVSHKMGYVSKGCIENIETFAPHLRRYFS